MTRQDQATEKRAPSLARIEPVVRPRPGQEPVNLPNLLTLSRILLIPIFVVLFSDPTPERSLAAAVVFAIAAVTDIIDGYLARRRRQITSVGRLLDPVADKLLVLAGLVLLVQMGRVDAILAFLLIGREVAVTGMRAVAASEGVVMSAEALGKYKMVAQVLAILLLTVEDGIPPLAWYLHQTGTGILYVALVLSLVSGMHYGLEFWRSVVRGPGGAGPHAGAA